MRASGSRVAGAVVAFGVAVGCARGAKGPQGPAGGPGPFAPAPRIFDVSPSTVSYGVTAKITGENFATITSNDEVWVNGWKGEVLLADANDLYVDHLVPPDQAAPDVAQLVVVANHVPSGPFAVSRMPRGSVVSEPSAAIGAGFFVEGFTPRDDGSVAVIEDGRVVSIAPGGDLSLYPDDVPIVPEGTTWLGRADGIYYLHANDLMRWEDGEDNQLVAHLTGGTPTAIAFDAAANLYILEQVNAAQAQVLIRKSSDFTITQLASFAATGAASMWYQNGNLYVGDTGSTSVLQIALPAGTVTTYATGVTAKFLTGDGTDLFTYDAGHVMQIAAGAVTQWSTTTLGATTVIGIARSALDGAMLLLAQGGVVFRMPDPATLQTLGAPLTGLRAVGANGAQIYVGSPAGCGDGNSDGGVLYELRLDGTMRWVTDGFCGTRLISVSFADGRLVWADATSGTVMSVDGTAGGTPTPLFAPATLVDPRFVVPLADGSLLVPNQDVGGQYRVSRYDGTGNLVDANWSPDDPDAPDAGVLAGSDVDLSYASLGQIRTVAAATGGPLVALTSSSFAPDATGLSLDVTNDLVISDPASDSVWLLAPSALPVRIAQASDSSPWFFVGDGRLATAGVNSLDLVLP